MATSTDEPTAPEDDGSLARVPLVQHSDYHVVHGLERIISERLMPPEPSVGCCERARYHVKVMLDEYPRIMDMLQVFVMGWILLSTACVIAETVPQIEARFADAFVLLEDIFTIFFTVEMLMRVWLADDRCRYLSTMSSLIDLLSTLPWYLEMAMASAMSWAERPRWTGLTGAQMSEVARLMRNDKDEDHAADALYTLRMLRMVRLMRVLRLAKAARHSEVIGIVFGSVQNSIEGMVALVAFTCMGALFAATLVFHLECEEAQTEFTSIPAALWWSLPTITGVGYGDMLPQTGLGKGAGCVTMVCGILITSCSAAIMTTSFMETYEQKMYTVKMQRTRRRLRKSGRVSEAPSEASPGAASLSDATSAASPALRSERGVPEGITEDIDFIEGLIDKVLLRIEGGGSTSSSRRKSCQVGAESTAGFCRDQAKMLIRQMRYAASQADARDA
eukprot:TRINITY_DN11491_c0_g2_i1.p1 TRINITY_DN11491_c0_g2~~TRINITY_DN11491_c0_g2_i1.p1  ORF type:complete len:448 (-),score=92.60 TRINITY_DN11491_c0_g2_i1:89-1432(-)